MTEQDRTPNTADDDTTGHGRGYPGDIEREDEDDTTAAGSRMTANTRMITTPMTTP
jgi:hypothetical protein